MQPLPVELEGLSRRFGAREALADVDLAVSRGAIVGLVGPNGSGKTTLLSIVAGLLRAHAGRVRVFGVDPFVDGPAILERARFAFAPPAFFPDLTAREHLHHLARIRRARTPRVSRAEIDAALALVSLSDRAGDRVRTFSLGMKQRLALAQALLPRPELIVLDEPTEGLDPLAVLELRAVLAELRAEHGLSVLLSSHLMVEVEELVDDLLVLREGRSLFRGRPDELGAEARELRLEVGPEARERARAALAAKGHAARPVGHELALPDGALTLDEARSLLGDAGLALHCVRRHRPSLEEALLARLRAADDAAVVRS